MAMPDLQRYPDKNVEDIVVFLSRKVFISASSSIASHKQEMRKSLSHKNRKWRTVKKQKNIDI